MVRNILTGFILLLLCAHISGQDAGLSLTWDGTLYVVKMEVVTGANPLLLGSSQVSIVTPASTTTAGIVVTCVSPCSVSQWNANTFVNAPPAAPNNNFVAIATLGGNMGSVANGSSVTLFKFALPGGTCDQNVRLFINGTDPNSGQMPGGQDFSNTLVNGLTAFEFYNGINTNDVNCLPLPLDLLRFAASYQQKFVLLNWETQHEREMQYYDIQRSVDGVRYETIGQKRAANTPEAWYDFTDERLPLGVGILYYRLEEIAIDRDPVYSPVRQVRIPVEQLRISASPVPASTVLTVHVDSPEEVTASVVISDVTLRNLYSKRHALAKGENLIDIPVSDWPAGTYLLTVQAGTGKAEQRVMVSH